MRNRYPAIILLLATPPALAEPPADSWAQVPALPTSCYSAGDAFQDDAYAAIEALQSEKSRQDEVNQSMSQQLHEVDMMELQQRMVTYMMEHPEDAQRAMTALQQGGQQMAEQTPEMSERSARFETRLRELTAEYEAALSQTIGSIEQQRQTLRASKEWCSQASLARDAALSRETNQSYESLCNLWWKEGGAFHAWATEFRQFQIELAAQQDEYAATTTINYEIMGVGADQYRPTNSLGAASEYLRRAAQVYSKRNFAPLSEEPIEACSDGHG